MPSPDYDLTFFQSALESLEQYLLAGDIYWPVSAVAPHGSPPYPTLTLGTMLLVQQQLNATAGAPAQQTAFRGMQDNMNIIRSQWLSAWRKKAQAEFRARLNLWRDFLQEYRKDPEAHYDRYGYEVGRRVMLQLLAGEASDLPSAQVELLVQLDRLLKTFFQPGAFIWEAELSPSFPEEIYWYLYGSLSET
jgi:hypothetical protein